MLFSRRLPVASLIRLCRELKHSLNAGIMLRDVFRQQARRGSRPVQPVAQRITDALESGESLHDALAAEQAYFPPLFLSLTTVGEQSGNMPEVFAALENYYEMQHRFLKQFLSQSFLPVVQFVVSTLVISGMLLILGVIAESRGGEPLDPLGLGLTGPRGALLFLVGIYGTLAALAAAYLLVTRSLRRKAVVDRVLLRLPVIGPFMQALTLARFTLAMRLTLDSAMSIGRALRLSFLATGNEAYVGAGESVEKAVLGGEALGRTMARCQLFPEDFLNVLAVAEQGGRVPEVMGQLAQQYEEEANHRLVLLTRASGFAVWLIVACFIIVAIFKIAFLYLNTIDQALKGVGG